MEMVNFLNQHNEISFDNNQMNVFRILIIVFTGLASILKSLESWKLIFTGETGVLYAL